MTILNALLLTISLRITMPALLLTAFPPLSSTRICRFPVKQQHAADKIEALRCALFEGRECRRNIYDDLSASFDLSEPFNRLSTFLVEKHTRIPCILRLRKWVLVELG